MSSGVDGIRVDVRIGKMFFRVGFPEESSLYSSLMRDWDGLKSHSILTRFPISWVRCCVGVELAGGLRYGQDDGGVSCGRVRLHPRLWTELHLLSPRILGSLPRLDYLPSTPHHLIVSSSHRLIFSHRCAS